MGFEQQLIRQMGEAMARRTDAGLWWLGLEEHYRVYATNMLLETLDEMKPRWIPSRLWDYLHRGDK